MGGTFDPIHHGHLVAAEEASWHLRLDEVVFVPAGAPWMKEHAVAASGEDRHRMTVLATSGNPTFSVSRAEVDRDGPTHTVDTLRQMRGEMGEDDQIYFITGADAVLGISAWKDPDEVMRLAHVVAATRPGYDLDPSKGEGLARDIELLDVPALAISSTDIRARVREGRPIRYLVPDPVREHIEETGLYR